MKEQMIFVAEITMAVDAAGTLETHLACSGEGFATRPTDTPANVAVPPTLIDPGSLRREMFSGDRVFGAVRPAFGEVVLYNSDGRYDAWEHHGFDGRDFVLRWGPVGGAYPADFTTVVICTVDGITLTEANASLRLRDSSQLLDKPFLKDAFTGVSTPEGGAAMKGVPKRRTIGTAAWAGPAPEVLVGASLGTLFHVSTGGLLGSILAWDNGNQIYQENYASNFWDSSPFPSPGTFWVTVLNGNIYMRTGTRIFGDLRVYLQTTQADGSLWNMQAIVSETGYTGTYIGTQIPRITGCFADSSITYARILDDAASFAGMWYGFDRLGRFVSKTFEAPSGTPLLTLSRSNCISVKRSPVPGMETPMHQLSVNSIQTWKSNYTSPGDYLRERFQADQWLRRFSDSDPDVLLKHKAARNVPLDLLVGPDLPSEFSAMYDRYKSLFGVERSLITAVVPLSEESMAVDLSDVVKVQWPRFNLSGGRLFRVVSVRYALRERQIEFALWG